ncbi:MAG TPA: TIM-barrel domain-containing protein, partial [Sphingomicrobium sp.]
MKVRCVIAAFFLGATSVATRAPAQTIPTRAVATEYSRDGLAALSHGVRVQVTALTDSILRVRIAKGSQLPEDASWAVPAAVRRQSVSISPTADGFQTKAIAVHLNPGTLGMTVTDLQGRTILADGPEPIRFDGTGFTLRKALPTDQRIYGMGDKTGALDRRGGTFVDWNTDYFGFAPWSDPIYKSIPFFIGVSGDGQAYGLFLDNSWRSSFDFGHRDSSAIEIGAPNGPADYYVIAGPSVAEVVRRYTDLTGKPPMPPQWALGYQQSRWGYSSDAEVRDIARHLRSDNIPADVIWMDID